MDNKGDKIKHKMHCSNLKKKEDGTIPVIPLNAYGLNTPMKRYEQSDWIKNKMELYSVHKEHNHKN